MHTNSLSLNSTPSSHSTLIRASLDRWRGERTKPRQRAVVRFGSVIEYVRDIQEEEREEKEEKGVCEAGFIRSKGICFD